MTILNIGFTKINVEKTGKLSKDMQIKSNMKVIDVTSSKMTSNAKQQAFIIKFGYDVDYAPKVGNINLEGELVFLADEKMSEEIEKDWKDSKKLPKSITLAVFNRILHHCNVESLILSRDIALPPPIQLPKVKIDEK